MKKIIEWDLKMLERLQSFQLPNYYKRVGVIVSILIVLVVIGLKFIDNEPLWIRALLKNGILFGLLLISLSREKVEDEMMMAIRAQSYRIAFILGVLYSFFQPYVNYLVDLLLHPEDASTEMSYVQVISFMLLIQVFLFHVLLKKCRL